MSSSLRYFIYLRKSSESEERQELSIPAQAREIEALVARRTLTVKKPLFEESRSAKEPGRLIFNDVLDRVMKGDADGILCWKLDRLARNPIDGGRVMYALGKGLIKEIVTPERTYTGTGDDKLLMSIIFGMATKYSDDLSDNVKRGNREALERGRWPGKPKLGYIRDHVTMGLLADPERFELVRDVWRKVLGGVRPLDALAYARTTLHLRTATRGKIGGKLIGKAGLYRLLRDPFYRGVMRHGRDEHAGTHPAMVTLAEFQTVQDLLDGRLRPRTRPQEHFFPYRGLIQCGACGAAVTAKTTTNRYGKEYRHYYCCRKERRYGYCAEPAVQERHLEEQLGQWLAGLVPPTAWLKALEHNLTQLLELETGAGRQAEQAAERNLAAVDQQLARERDLLLREVIAEEDYLADRARLTTERQVLVENLAIAKDPKRLVEPWQDAVGVLYSAKELFASGDPAGKRAILEKVTWNLQLTGRILRMAAKKPFALLGEWSRCPSLSG